MTTENTTSSENGGNSDTRVLIAANYASVRAGLAALLDNEPGVVVLGEVASEPDALRRLLPTMQPDVVVLDTSGDGASASSVSDVINALSVCENAKSDAPPPALVVLGDAPERDLPILTTTGGAAAQLPGWGYLLRAVADGPQIARAVQAAASGLLLLDRSSSFWSLPPAPATASIKPTVPTLPGETLTPREMEVLQLMAQGLPNKIIASRLKISLHTAKFHVAQILGKLNATSRTEAVTLGARRGYILL